MTSPDRPEPGGSPERRTGGTAVAPDPDGDSIATAAGKRVYAPDFLTELFRNPLDPGYADAAARRAAGGGRTGASRRVAGAVTAVVSVGIGFLLVVAYQQTVADEPARTRTRQELADQVQKRRDETGELQQRADRLADEVADLRERELGGAAVAGLVDLEAAAGLGRVRGPGVRVVLGDGPSTVEPVTGQRRTEGQVKDSDLQLASNALWAAGAEAIAINGQRLTATSTIRQAGEAILVDIRPVSSPYEVVAIGPDELADEFRDSSAGRLFKTLSARFGMSFKVSEVKSVTLEPAAELKLRVAVPSIAPPASPGASSPSSAGGTQTAPSASASEGGR